MTDTTTRARIEVETSEGAGPMITLPEERLDEVKRALDGANIPYWADEESMSVDGEPYITWLYFSRKVDPVAIQSVLDRLP